MKVVAAEILQLSIPFRLTFRHSLAERSQVESVVVRLRDADGNLGYGECIPRDYVTGESLESATASVRGNWIPRLIESSFESFEDSVRGVEALLPSLPRDQHAAFCAVELALLDLAGRAFGVSAGTVVGPIQHRSVNYSGVVSSGSVAEALRICERYFTAGFKSMKFKVGPDTNHNRAILEGARAIFGQDTSFRVDANCAWSPAEALELIGTLAEFRLDGVEQPVARDDIDGLAWLTARSPVPVIVDESLASFDDAIQLIQRRAGNIFNLRISKCGGLINSVRIRALAQRSGIRCMLGAQVGETVLLSAAGRHFATRSGGLAFLEGSFGTLLLERDIGVQEQRLGPAGQANALDSPGLGVDVDERALHDLTLRSEAIGVMSCPSSRSSP
jgi:muconate cycloisomerase